MAEVIIKARESLENALRRFNRKVQAEAIMKEVKRHSFFRSRSQQQRDKSHNARVSRAKRLRGQQRQWERKTCGGTGTGYYGRVR